MTDSLPFVLKAEIERFEALLKTVDSEAEHPDTILALATGMSMSCTFEAELSEGGRGGPTIEVQANVLPGGRIGDARLELREGGASAREYIEPDSGLHRALAVWFTDMWDTWEEVPEGTPGELLGVRAEDLLPGDRLVRLDLTVAGVEDSGINSAGEGMCCAPRRGSRRSAGSTASSR